MRKPVDSPVPSPEASGHRAFWDSKHAWLNASRKASTSLDVVELSLEMTQEVG